MMFMPLTPLRSLSILLSCTFISSTLSACAEPLPGFRYQTPRWRHKAGHLIHHWLEVVIQHAKSVQLQQL
jgi:hypothetical protein